MHVLLEKLEISADVHHALPPPPASNHIGSTDTSTDSAAQSLDWKRLDIGSDSVSEAHVGQAAQTMSWRWLG